MLSRPPDTQQVSSGWYKDPDSPSLADSKNIADVSGRPHKLSLTVTGVGVDIVRRINYHSLAALQFHGMRRDSGWVHCTEVRIERGPGWRSGSSRM